MPYKDPEKRRTFHREYKRKYRTQGKINPLRGFKVYVCPSFPDFRLIARAHFNNGFLITNDVSVQAQVEAHREFGRRIFALVLDHTCLPKEDQDE